MIFISQHQEIWLLKFQLHNLFCSDQDLDPASPEFKWTSAEVLCAESFQDQALCAESGVSFSSDVVPDRQLHLYYAGCWTK